MLYSASHTISDKIQKTYRDLGSDNGLKGQLKQNMFTGNVIATCKNKIEDKR